MQADGLILAGGKSTRMGGRHKGDLFFQEQTFLERIIEELKKVVSTVWISYGDLIRREYPGCEIVQDKYPERGPIGGFHAGFKKSRSELIFTAACDMPFLRARLYHFLCERLEQAEEERGLTYEGAVPVTDGRPHPLTAVYRKSLAGSLERQIQNDDLRLTSWLGGQDILYVDVTHMPAYRKMLRNVNSLAEYQALLLCGDPDGAAGSRYPAGGYFDPMPGGRTRTERSFDSLPGGRMARTGGGSGPLPEGGMRGEEAFDPVPGSRTWAGRTFAPVSGDWTRMGGTFAPASGDRTRTEGTFGPVPGSGGWPEGTGDYGWRMGADTGPVRQSHGMPDGPRDDMWEEDPGARQRIVAVCGIKNSGKTTLLVRLIRTLSAQGISAAVVKHDGHEFTCDIPGTDSYQFWEAGACGTAVYSRGQSFIHKRGQMDERELLSRFPEADILFIEGQKDSYYPKIEVIRRAAGGTGLPVSEPTGRFLLVTDVDPDYFTEPAVGFDDLEEIVERILAIPPGLGSIR